MGFELGRNLELSQVVEVVVIEVTVVDRLEAKAFNNFLLALTLQLTDKHGDISVGRKHLFG